MPDDRENVELRVGINVYTHTHTHTHIYICIYIYIYIYIYTTHGNNTYCKAYKSCDEIIDENTEYTKRLELKSQRKKKHY